MQYQRPKWAQRQHPCGRSNGSEGQDLSLAKENYIISGKKFLVFLHIFQGKKGGGALQIQL
jgi:hypothetical protein